ncbi:MAG: sugar kinase [Hyphomicrobiales bacterium]
MNKLLCVGEIMLEMAQLTPNTYKKSYAGDCFNVAHYASIIGGSHIQVDYLTTIGNDVESDDCFQFIKEHAVGTQKIIRDERNTIGLFLLSNDEFGEKQYAYWRSVSAAKHLFEQTRDMSDYDFIQFSGITAAITINKDNLIASLKSAKLNGSDIIFDFNYRQQLWSIEEVIDFTNKILKIVDIVKISSEELDLLFPNKTIADFSEEFKHIEWILTCGGAKAEIWKGGYLMAQQKFKPKLKVIDTSAAGDSFLGTFIGSLNQGFSAAERLSRSHKVATQVIASKGSIIPIKFNELEF